MTIENEVAANKAAIDSLRLELKDIQSHQAEQENDPESAIMTIERNVTAIKVAIDSFQVELEDLMIKHAEQENDSDSAMLTIEKTVAATKAAIDKFRVELEDVKSKYAEQDKTTMQVLAGFVDILSGVNLTYDAVAGIFLNKEVHACNQSGSGYLVSGVYGVPDNHLVASSSYITHNTNYYGPQRGRLNDMSDVTSTGEGAWCSETRDRNQWIQVELNTESTIIKVTTQGRKDWSQWVRSYKVQYSVDDWAWMTVKTRFGQDQVFTGNTDRNSLVTNVLQQPIRARFVRLLPQTWYAHICMRFDITGCPY